MQKHHAFFLQLTQMNADARLEFLAMMAPGRSRTYQEIIQSMNRLTQHAGGMKSSVLKQDDMLLNRRLSSADIDLLQDILENVGPALQELSDRCHFVLRDVDQVLRETTPNRFLWPVHAYNASMSAVHRVHGLQEQLGRSLEHFTNSQKHILRALYDNDKFDGKPSDELFLVYYFVFCLMEFAKELKSGLLQTVKQAKRSEAGSRPWGWFWCCFGAAELVDEYHDTPLHETTSSRRLKRAQTEPAKMPARKKAPAATRYFDFLQSQTNQAYHRYLKSPFRSSKSKQQQLQQRSLLGSHQPSHSSLENDIERQPLLPLESTEFPAEQPPIRISLILQHRLRLWKFLSSIGNSFELKYAFKMALLVTCIATLAFLPDTREVYREFRGHWIIISVCATMTTTVGGTNLAGVYRILGTIAGAGYSYLAWNLFPYDPVGLMIMIALFAVPCFYLFLYSQYPRVAQVSLVAVSAIILANYSNRDNPNWSLTIWDLAWKRGVMVISGIAIGLLVTWVCL